MPRLRVDADTSEAELVEHLALLHSGWHDIDDRRPILAAEIEAASRAVREPIEYEYEVGIRAMNDLHDEIERLTNIIRHRRSRVVA